MPDWTNGLYFNIFQLVISFKRKNSPKYHDIKTTIIMKKFTYYAIEVISNRGVKLRIV